MKILIINLRIDSGSVGRIVSDLYNGIKKNGNECKIAYARGGIGKINKEDTIKICSDFEVHKHALLTRLFGRTAFWSKGNTKKFLKKIDSYSPDIIHIHGLYGYYINMEVLFNYIKDKKIKLVSTLHSCWDFTGHCCYFDYIHCEKWKYNCDHCTQIKSYPKSYFDNTKKNYEKKKNLYNQLNDCIIVTPSQWLTNLAKQSFLKKNTIITINNGIDTEIFKPTYDDEVLDKYGINKNKKSILCVASTWDKRKGLEDAIELVNYLLEDIQLIIVGINKKQIENISEKVVCIPRTDNVHELATLYTFATLFFNPTYEDNYPTVNLEAIACGTPVVTYDTGGSTEIVENTKLGKIIKKKAYNEIVRLLEFNYNNDNISKIIEMLQSTSPKVVALLH